MSFPETIEAITIPKHGDVDVIEKTTLPFPEVKPGEVVIKVEYGGVNFIDTYFRAGLYPLKQFPAIVGSEASGIIVGLPTDTETLNHEVYKRQNYKIGAKVAVDKLGAFATYISVPWKNVYLVPENVDLKVAAAGLTQSLTCTTFLEAAYNVKKGETVLVHTIAGGVGLIFAQLISARGATVIGTTSSKEKAELAKAHGATHVINYREEDTVARVLELTGGQGVDVIFDGVGKDTFESDFKMIKRKGTIISYGNASGAVPPVPLFKLTEKNVKLMRPTVFNYLATPEEVEHYGQYTLGLIASGAIKVNIWKAYPFTAEAVKEAQTDLVKGKSTGKLLIKIGSDA